MSAATPEKHSGRNAVQEKRQNSLFDYCPHFSKNAFLEYCAHLCDRLLHTERSVNIFKEVFVMRTKPKNGLNKPHDNIEHINIEEY